MKNKLEIKYLKTDLLIPYVNNARTHDEAQIAQIAASIKEFNFNNPILLDGDNGIVAGHGRLMAAKKLGLAEVPCIELSHLSEAQKKAYILADNKLALNAGWDDDFIALEMMELKDSDIDLLKIGLDFDVPEFDSGEDFTPTVPSGDKSPIKTMTLTLSNEQFEQISEIVKGEKENGFDPMEINENSNGNAIYFICKQFEESKCVS